MVWVGRREVGSGWGTHEYLWWIHADIWQNQYNIVKLKKKIFEHSDFIAQVCKKKKIRCQQGSLVLAQEE